MRLFRSTDKFFIRLCSGYYKSKTHHIINQICLASTITSNGKNSLTQKKTQIIDIKAPSSKPKLANTLEDQADQLLKWLERSNPKIGEQDFILQSLELHINNLAKTGSIIRPLGFITHVLKGIKKSRRVNEPLLSKDSVQIFVNSTAIENLLFKANKRKDVRPHLLGVIIAMAEVEAIPLNNVNLLCRALQLLACSEKDNFTPLCIWFRAAKKGYKRFPLYVYNAVIISCSKPTEASLKFRLEILREAIEDIKTNRKPSFLTFKAIFRAFAVISSHKTGRTLISGLEIKAVESWLEQFSAYTDKALDIYRMQTYRNLGELDKLNELYKSFSLIEDGQSKKAATSILLAGLATCASAAKFNNQKAYVDCMNSFSQILETDPESLNIRSFTTMLRLCSTFRDEGKAEWLLSKFPSLPAFTLDERFLSQIVRYYASIGKIDSMMRTFYRISDMGFTPSRVALASVVIGLSKALWNRQANDFYENIYLHQVKIIDPHLEYVLLGAHAQTLDLQLFEPLYQKLISREEVQVFAFELRMKLAIKFESQILARGTMCDSLNLNITPSTKLIDLLLDFIVAHLNSIGYPTQSPIKLANTAIELIQEKPFRELIENDLSSNLFEIISAKEQKVSSNFAALTVKQPSINPKQHIVALNPLEPTSFILRKIYRRVSNAAKLRYSS